jgi:hypothetical protein
MSHVPPFSPAGKTLLSGRGRPNCRDAPLGVSPVGPPWGVSQATRTVQELLGQRRGASPEAAGRTTYRRRRVFRLRRRTTYRLRRVFRLRGRTTHRLRRVFRLQRQTAGGPP